MSDMTMTAPSDASVPTKWWGHSMTIWGAAITALSTVLPAVGPLVGMDINAEMVRQLGEQSLHIAQAVGGLVGTVLTVYGRSRAVSKLVSREFKLTV